MNPTQPENPHVEPVPGTHRPSSPVDGKPAKPQRSKTESPSVNRPPKPPPDIIGPYFQFITTEDHKWRGSALVLHRGGPRPELSFDHEFEQDCHVLYDDIFGMTALRYNISTIIEDGTGDEKIGWTITWQKGHESHGAFHIPRWEQKWRGGFFSCNGFDMTVPEGTVKDLGFDNVWKHLNSVHEETPFHILIWGGDQIYIDFIFEDIPFLKRWIDMDWENKWSHEFSEETSRQVAEYYFNAYGETWERDEVKAALRSVPGIMQWDDHDIFDGAGSYPPEQHDSPVMTGLVRSAQKFRLLFQHHTTPLLARQHGLIGNKGYNFVAQLGPRLAAIGLDGRTERDWKQIGDSKTWDMIFDNLDAIAPSTHHLIAIFPVPFSFIRIRAAEKIFDVLRKRAPWVRFLPGLKGTNSIFGLPELYDDLLDEWTHDAHIRERDAVLKRFQKLADKHDLRVTFLSGDVHCAAFSRFRSDKSTRDQYHLTPETDSKLMYQVISSAIVNQAPSANVCIAYHYLKTKWNPIPQTEEMLVEMFERRPERGKHVRHRKVMPNRNWCYFEEIGAKGGSGGSEIHNSLRNSGEQTHRHFHRGQDDKDHRHLEWVRTHYAFDRKKGYPSTLGPTSSASGSGVSGAPLHKHHHGPFCHHRKSKFLHVGSNMNTQKSEDASNGIGQEASSQPGSAERSGLRLRLWLESRQKEEKGRQFASYEVVVPDLAKKSEQSSK